MSAEDQTGRQWIRQARGEHLDHRTTWSTWTTWTSHSYDAIRGAVGRLPPDRP